MNIKERLLNMLFSETTAVKWSLGWCGLLLAFGFFFSATDTENYDLINGTAQQTQWAFVFLIYGLLMLASSMYFLKAKLSYAISFFGLFLWTYIFLSFVWFDPTTIKSTEWLLVVPICLEIWILASKLFAFGAPQK